MATPNVLKLLLPNSKTSSQSIKHPMVISVTGDLQYAVNNSPVPMDQLESTIKGLIANQTDPTALLKIDKTVQLQNLVETSRHRQPQQNKNGARYFYIKEIKSGFNEFAITN